jgi:hypothetical protein
MPCYSYTSGTTISYENMVEKVWSGSGTTYSYNSLYWICEFEEAAQLKVFTRATPLSVETQLIQGTNYTVNTTTKNIVLTVPVNTGQVVIRRSTPWEKMLVVFNEGAKLTAEQLNLSFHQLLFTIQEKEFQGSTFNHYFFPPAVVPTWNALTDYTTGDYVLYNGNYYYAVTDPGVGQTPLNPGFWTQIAFSNNGIIVIGAPNARIEPLVFDLSTIQPGQKLVWTGDRIIGTTIGLNDAFISNPQSGDILIYSGPTPQLINAAATVDITENNLVLYDRCFYRTRSVATAESGLNNTPYVKSVAGLTAQQADFDDSEDYSSVTLIKPFKNINNSWVLLDAPTTYKLIKNMIPLQNPSNPSSPPRENPEIFFQRLQTDIADLVASGCGAPNAIKVKFVWHANQNKTGQVGVDTSSYGGIPVPKSQYALLGTDRSLDTAFWDHPRELYSPWGYVPIDIAYYPSPGGDSATQDANGMVAKALYYQANASVVVNGVTETGLDRYKIENPFFSGDMYTLFGPSPCTANATPGSPSACIRSLEFTSKLYGLNIKSFYLSIPECKTTTLFIPILRNTTTSPYTLIGNTVDHIDILPSINAIGMETESHNQTLFARDYYLLGLRDLAFAATRRLEQFNGSVSMSNTKWRDTLVRYAKGDLIQAEYNGWNQTFFKRLETSEAYKQITFKIPEQIIYYNKAALALSDKTYSPVSGGISRATATGDRTNVRFQGYYRPYFGGLDTKTDASFDSIRLARGTLFSGVFGVQGSYYWKADSVWTEWTNAWQGLSGIETEDRQYNVNTFNEACIDWITWGTQIASNAIVTTPNYFRSVQNLPPTTYINTTVSNDGTVGASVANKEGKFFVPWPYRPNELVPNSGGTAIETSGLNGTSFGAGTSGTHLLNIDANKLFSEAHNFIPDPMDEYVFRIVAKKDITEQIVQPGDPVLRTSAILEWGLADSANSNSPTTVNGSTLSNVFKDFSSLQDREVMRVNSRYDYSKIKVFIKNETLESAPITNDVRYIITLVIRVPRIKSIGYCSIFRKWHPDAATNNVPEYTSINDDTNKDLGPWNFADIDFKNNLLTGGLTYLTSSSMVTYDNLVNSAVSTQFDSHEGTGVNNTASSMTAPMISGRNECAVKFVRAGIPSNLWIRLSVLVSNQLQPLLNGDYQYYGFDSNVIDEN